MTIAPEDGRLGLHSSFALSDDEITTHLREHRVTAQRSVRAVLGASADEEDLIQEVLTRLVVRLRQPGEIAVGAWTWTVAHNVAIDYLRARRATPTDLAALDRGTGDGLDAHVMGAELATAVREGLARLPPRQRDALVVQAGLDGGRGGHALVAANLGVSPKAAESILARARQSLRRELDHFGLRDGPWVAAGAAVRGLRRLVRPKTAVAGVAALTAVTVLSTTALVVRRPLDPPAPAGSEVRAQPGSDSTPTQVVLSPMPIFVRMGLPGVTPADPQDPAAPLSPAAAGSSPRVVPPAAAGRPTGPDIPVPGVSLPPIVTPATPLLGGITVPSSPPVTLPAVPPITLPALPPITLPGLTITLPALPTVSLPALPPVTVPALPPVKLPGLPPVTVPALPPVSLPALPSVSVPALPPVSLPAVPPITLPALPSLPGILP